MFPLFDKFWKCILFTKTFQQHSLVFKNLYTYDLIWKYKQNWIDVFSILKLKMIICLIIIQVFVSDGHKLNNLTAKWSAGKWYNLICLLQSEKLKYRKVKCFDPLQCFCLKINSQTCCMYKNQNQKGFQIFLLFWVLFYCVCVFEAFCSVHFNDLDSTLNKEEKCML